MTRTTPIRFAASAATLLALALTATPTPLAVAQSAAGANPADFQAAGEEAGDPMEDATSREVRAAYAACNAMEEGLSRYFCLCEVVDRQCEAARKPGHGAWRTIEVWPTDDNADREVYFELASEGGGTVFDDAPQAVIVACMANARSVTLHLGTDADAGEPVAVRARIPGQEVRDIAVDVDEPDTSTIAVVSDSADAWSALSEADALSLGYTDSWGEAREVEFDPRGFANAVAGWEPLCGAPAS